MTDPATDGPRPALRPVHPPERELRNLSLLRSAAVAVIRIDAPDKHNAMGPHFWPELRGVLDELAGDGQTRAVVVTGAGDRAFSAGGDIASFTELTDVRAKREFQRECMRTFAAVEESPLPIVAAVNGWALGGGCELAMACDIVLAGQSAVFGMPEATIGLVPGFGVLRGPAVIGRHWTRLMVFAGERVDADTALRIGLVQKVVPDAELMSSALALAERIAANAPLAVAAGKGLVNRGVDRGEFEHSIHALTALHCTTDTAEGIRAFLDKRRPRFRGE